MNNASHFHMPSNRAPLADAGIDWEPLPSLVHLVSRAKPPEYGDEPAWRETMPAEFDAAPQSGPFIEALPGVMLREVHEPDIFKLFFDR